MPATRPVSRQQDITAESFSEWIQFHIKLVVAAVVVLVAAGAAVWFYLAVQHRQEVNASHSMDAARTAVASQNLVLAKNELQRTVTRWPNTMGGREAALLLAQIDYEQGQYQEGVDVLKKLRSTNADFSPGAVQNLLADGYEQLGKAGEAAKAFEQAAAAARFPRDSAEYLLSAARAYFEAGNKADAMRIWQALSESSITEVAAEARVRLGEVEAEPAQASKS